MSDVGVHRFTDLRAWQVSRSFKKAVYVLCASGSLAADTKLRGQLEDAAAGAPRQLAEGFGRFTVAAPRNGAPGKTGDLSPSGSSAVGGYDPNAYAPGAGQEPAPLPPPLPPPDHGGVGGGETAPNG